MKRLAAVALAAGISTAQAQPGVSLSIDIVQPGVYGRVVIGDIDPRPIVMAPAPIVVTPSRYARVRRPIYLYVPLAQQREWPRFCARYGACDQPVYFVRDQWVRERYAEHHRRREPHYRAAPPMRGRGDRDRDGVPDRYDRRPNDPYRR